MEPVLCKKHGCEKVIMRNRNRAPIVACPQCKGVEPENKPAPPPPTPPPLPAPAKQKWGTFFHGGE